MSTPIALAGLERDEVLQALAPLGQPAYRADQVLEWYYKRRADSFNLMTNIPGALREKLPDFIALSSSEVADAREDADGTTKLAIRLHDGHTVETVLIPERPRLTACLSTQVGCPVGCAFCASGARGVERNLETAEIVEQAMHVERRLDRDDRITHIVFMGIGEGLLNLPRLLKAVHILNAPWGLNIGARRMTVSTVGIPGTVEKLIASGLQISLAISLHAPTDELRAKLIRHKTLMSVEDLMNAAEDYYEYTGREPTFEYVLLAGVNDSADMAKALAKRLKSVHATVNLIPYNEVEGSGFKRPSMNIVKDFRRALETRGVNVTLRRRHGEGVRAACGQLRLDSPLPPSGAAHGEGTKQETE